MSKDGADGLRVIGGSGGVEVTTENLHHHAGVVLEIGADVAAVAARVATVSLDPGVLLAGVFDPVGAARVHAAVANLVAGPQGLGAAGSRLSTLSIELNLAAEQYYLAEVDTEYLLTQVWHAADETVFARVSVAVRGAAARAGIAAAPALGWGVAAVGLGVGVWVFVRSAPVAVDTAEELIAAGRAGELSVTRVLTEVAVDRVEIGERLIADAEVVRDGATDLLHEYPWLVREGIAQAPGLVAGMLPDELSDVAPDDVTELTGILAGGAAAAGLLRQGDVRVHPVGSAAVSRPPGSVAETAARLRDVDPGSAGSAGSARIRIDRIEPVPGEVPGRAEATRFVVYLPSLATTEPGSDQPADISAAALALGQRDNDALEAALEAMRAAGIGPDDPVMLVGHSLGGLTAAQAASMSAASGEFRVENVMTLGSPVSGYEVPGQTRMLSVVNEGDVVPELDGELDPDEARRVTVIGDGARGDDGNPHDLDQYVGLAGRVDRAQDLSVRAWWAGASDFLDPQRSVTVTTQSYDATRVP